MEATARVFVEPRHCQCHAQEEDCDAGKGEAEEVGEQGPTAMQTHEARDSTVVVMDDGDEQVGEEQYGTELVFGGDEDGPVPAMEMIPTNSNVVR